MRRLGTVLLVVGAFACGSEDGDAGADAGGTDAGAPLDAGGTTDAGAATDAGPLPDGALVDAGYGGTGAGDCTSVVEMELLAATNAARAEAGVTEVSCDAEISAVAQAQAQDMCDRDYFDHTSPDGRSYRDRLDDAGVTYTVAEALLSAGQPTADAVTEAVLGADSTADIVLRDGQDRAGFGYVACPTASRSPLWVHILGR